jgi:hypothetical protein
MSRRTAGGIAYFKEKERKKKNRTLMSKQRQPKKRKRGKRREQRAYIPQKVDVLDAVHLESSKDFVRGVEIVL